MSNDVPLGTPSKSKSDDVGIPFPIAGLPAERWKSKPAASASIGSALTLAVIPAGGAPTPNHRLFDPATSPAAAPVATYDSPLFAKTRLSTRCIDSFGLPPPLLKAPES